MLRPTRLKRPKMGVRDVVRLVWTKHQAFVRRHACSVPGCTNRPIEFAHVRNAANSGASIKPHDAFGIPLCSGHHEEAHRGEKTFCRKYGIDPYKIAAWFLRNSPDLAMRESFAELPAHVKRRLLEAA